MDLPSKLEALLFFKAEPLSRERLRRTLGVTDEALHKALSELRERLKNRGVCLVENGDKVTMTTASEAVALIRDWQKEEMTGELSRAALETLSVILYSAPIARREIDYIRGVNCAFTLRNLLVRDLAERVQNPEDERGFLYRPTVSVLSFLGVSRQEELPGYEAFRKEFEALRAAEKGAETPELKARPEDQPSEGKQS
jgi:segregation and condensation protein B